LSSMGEGGNGFNLDNAKIASVTISFTYAINEGRLGGHLPLTDWRAVSGLWRFKLRLLWSGFFYFPLRLLFGPFSRSLGAALRQWSMKNGMVME